MMDTDRSFRCPVATANSPAPSTPVVATHPDADGLTVARGPAPSGNRARLWGSWACDTTGTLAITALPRDDESEEAFSREKLFFEQLPASELRRLAQRHVAIHGQRIVDSDPDLYALTNRFFSMFGDVPVYIRFVGTRPLELIPSPILR